jgi:hypothetical protein
VQLITQAVPTKTPQMPKECRKIVLNEAVKKMEELEMSEKPEFKLMRRSGFNQKRSRKHSPKRIQRPNPFLDTNCIYPPDKEYAEKYEELKSPQKRRPLSGGPSPDKHKLKHKELEMRVMEEHREASLYLQKAKEDIAKTRKEI